METKTEKLPVTTKKQKFIGFDELYTKDGEAVPVQINQVEDRDFNFHKVWLRMFIEGLNGIANKKMKLAFWIVDNLDSENKLCYTLQQMAERTGLHYDTVVKTMAMLQKGDPPFLKKLHSGVYIINPDILYKGNHKGRMGIIYQFGEIPTKEQFERMAETRKREEENEKARAERDKMPSDAPQAPNSPETTDAGEKVPVESKTPQNEPNFELPMEKMTEIFRSETSCDFWAWAGSKNLENLPKFHAEWKAKQYKNA